MPRNPKQVWFGMKLKPEEKRKIERLAERWGVSQKAVVVELVEDAVAGEFPRARKGSFLDGIEHLIGSVEGPSDLATDPKHMEGYGR